MTSVDLPLDLQEAPAEGHVSLGGSVFLLCATTLGAGLLAMPFTVARVGIGLGSAALLVFAALTMYCIWMLVAASERRRVRAYEDLVDAAFPVGGRYVFTVLMVGLVFGALTGFLVIIGDVTLPLWHHVVAPNVFWGTRPVVVVVLTALVVLPLSMLRSIGKLEYTSFLAVGIILAFSGVVVYLGVHVLQRGVHWEDLSWFNYEIHGVFQALPIISLAYTCQFNVFPIWRELYRPTTQRINLVALLMTLVAAVLYVGVGVIGYIVYPTNTRSNVIENLPGSVFYDVVRALFGLAILCHYPVVHFSLRDAIERTFFASWDFSWVRHVALTVVMVALSCVVSLVLPSLSSVFEITGAVAGYPINFIIPALVYLKVFHWDSARDVPLMGATVRRRSPRRCHGLAHPGAVAPALVIVLSAVACVISTYAAIAALVA